jgi:hypothetical protein
MARTIVISTKLSGITGDSNQLAFHPRLATRGRRSGGRMRHTTDLPRMGARTLFADQECPVSGHSLSEANASTLSDNLK